MAKFAVSSSFYLIHLIQHNYSVYCYIFNSLKKKRLLSFLSHLWPSPWLVLTDRINLEDTRPRRPIISRQHLTSKGKRTSRLMFPRRKLTTSQVTIWLDTRARAQFIRNNTIKPISHLISRRHPTTVPIMVALINRKLKIILVTRNESS